MLSDLDNGVPAAARQMEQKIKKRGA